MLNYKTSKQELLQFNINICILSMTVHNWKQCPTLQLVMHVGDVTNYNINSQYSSAALAPCLVLIRADICTTLHGLKCSAWRLQYQDLAMTDIAFTMRYCAAVLWPRLL